MPCLKLSHLLAGSVATGGWRTLPSIICFNTIKALLKLDDLSFSESFGTFLLVLWRFTGVPVPWRISHSFGGSDWTAHLWKSVNTSISETSNHDFKVSKWNRERKLLPIQLAKNLCRDFFCWCPRSQTWPTFLIKTHVLQSSSTVTTIGQNKGPHWSQSTRLFEDSL